MTDKPQPISPHFNVELSDDAVAFMTSPVPNGTMPMVEGIYRCGTSKWLPATVMPSMEKKVEKNLKASGVNAFLPISATWAKQSAKAKHMKAAKVRIERPLFPGYIFVEIPQDTRPYAAVMSVYGFRDFLRDQGHPECPPIAINPEIINKLREEQNAGSFDQTIKKGRRFIPNWAVKDTWVRLREGPLASFDASIRAVLPHDMMRVEVFMFGRTTNVDVPIANVEPV